MDIQSGEYIIATLVDVKQTPWKNDASKFNRDLILAREYQDQNELTQNEVYQVGLNPEQFQMLTALKNTHQGKLVMVPVRNNTRSYNGRAFMNRFIPSDLHVQPLDAVFSRELKKVV